MSTERYIKIPDDLRKLYSHIGRPTPLYRAEKLEKYLKTPAKIYYKREDTTLEGSHKLNTAIAQVYYAKKDGFDTVTTETGAGQWGSSVALASSFFDVKSKIFMVGCSYDQKPHRKTVMKLYGAEVYRSPSNQTEFGRKLGKDRNHPGSLGIAISEAILTALKDEKTAYVLGSVLNHVILHQTVIGQELKKQLKKAGEEPEAMIGCVGGGSNFSGFCFPFVKQKLEGENIRFVAVEPKSVPTLTKGPYKYDYGDSAELTPLLKMYTLGHKFIPPAIHAGGLRYHGDAPALCLLKKAGIVEAVAYKQTEIFQAGRIFAKTEGIIPAPETCHAVKAVIDEATRARKRKEERTLVFNLSGHGLLDLKGYQEFIEGKLKIK